MTQDGAQVTKRKIGAFGYAVKIRRISWRDLAVALGPVLLIIVVTIWVAFRFVRPAPPDTMTITSGIEGSTFRTSAEQYRKILARNGVKLEILPSEGALENLKRLRDPEFKVDVGFVQGGLSADGDTGKLVSLGSVFFEPLVVFYRSAGPIDRLSQFRGGRLAIGREGSGTHFLNLLLLKANGIDAKGPTRLLNLDGDAAAQALLTHTADAVLLLGPAIGRQQDRQTHDEFAALAQAAAVRFHPSAVHLDEPTHEIQADAQAALRPFQRARRLREHLEHRGQHIAGNADAVVLHLHDNVAALAFHREPDMTAALGVLGTVIK